MWTRKEPEVKYYKYSIQYTNGNLEQITCSAVKEQGSLLLFKDENMQVKLAVPIQHIVHLKRDEN